MPFVRFNLVLGGLACVAAGAVAVGAQPVADHLHCYRVKDPQTKLSYLADLGGLVAEPGCLIRVPAQMACVPAVQTNATPTPPGTGAVGTPNEVFCYKVKCPRATLPTLAGADEFGSRTVTPTVTKLVCAPAVPSPRFVDNGDGTVTDRQTRLQWEKKTGIVGDPNNPNDSHNVNNTYTWGSFPDAHKDGTAYTDFLSTLNLCLGETPGGGFAGHCDWRVPTVAELQTILAGPPCGTSPCIDPVFGATRPSTYWSSNVGFSPSAFAFAVSFDNGSVLTQGPDLPLFVRGVRGGP